MMDIEYLETKDKLESMNAWRSRKRMSTVELRLNELIDACKNKMDEIRKLNELEKAFLDDELEVNHKEKMFTRLKEIDKYDFELLVLEQILKTLEYVRTGEYKREDKEI